MNPNRLQSKSITIHLFTEHNNPNATAETLHFLLIKNQFTSIQLSAAHTQIILHKFHKVSPITVL